MPVQHLDVFRLGRVPYADALGAQRRLQAQLVAARHDADAPRHALLIVEHDPVFTLGASGDLANVLLSEADLAARGATFARTDRGGDVTFHGPGQIVAYPILDLNRLQTPAGEPLRDLHRYLRALEDAVIRTCAGVGVAAGRVAGRTGVWVGPDARGAERKVCAMGIRCCALGDDARPRAQRHDRPRLVRPRRAVRHRGPRRDVARARDGRAARCASRRAWSPNVAHHVGAAAVVHADGPLP